MTRSLRILMLAGVLAGVPTIGRAALPECDSAGVTGLVDQLYRQSLGKGAGAAAVDVAASRVALSDVAEVSATEASRTCSAHTHFTVAAKEGADEAAVSKVAANWQYRMIEWSITPSQTTGKVVVEILKAQ